MPSDTHSPAPARTVSLFTATCIVIANMIGTGVFTSLGFQVGPLPSGFAILTLWLVGGLCALCGALAYGELASALPRSGGEYHFLSVIYHPAAGFLAGWISITIGFAAPVAVAAMACASYFQQAFPAAWSAEFNKFFSIALVALLTGIHLVGTKAGSRFQNGITVLKVALILVMIFAGFFLGEHQPLSFLPIAGDGHLLASTGFAVSLVYVMYAYSGWNAATYIVGEVRDASRNVPLAIIGGTIIVTVLYALLNVVMLRAAPLSALGKDPMSGNVAAVAAGYIFGTSGGRLVSGLICAGLVATAGAMIFIGPRVSVALGEDWSLFRPLARKTAGGVPANAILIQSAITVLLLLTATFDQVYKYIGFSLALCSFFTVLGVFVLRYRRPALPRPIRAWGYPITPLIFLAVTAWMLLHMLRESTRESLASLGTMLLGLICYAIGQWFSPTAARVPARDNE